MLKQLAERRWFHAHETARVDALNGLPLASFKRRAAALAIDGLLVALLKGPLALFTMLRHPHLAHAPASEWMEHLVSEIESLLESVLYFGVLVRLMHGQTPGKRLMKIRIVSLSHSEITWWQSIERALGYGASLLEAGTGFLQYFINRNRMCVHDRIAETIVVYEGKDAVRAAPPAPFQP